MVGWVFRHLGLGSAVLESGFQASGSGDGVRVGSGIWVGGVVGWVVS